jgi:hypothetical protein
MNGELREPAALALPDCSIRNNLVLSAYVAEIVYGYISGRTGPKTQAASARRS